MQGAYCNGVSRLHGRREFLGAEVEPGQAFTQCVFAVLPVVGLRSMRHEYAPGMQG